ncbi:GDSL-type esterase/lipase family protein [Nocardia sp. NPDC003345]
MSGDRRICFVGDSFVAGVGDPEALGWSGRLTAHAGTAGLALTAYNLGIRGNTSGDIAGRWLPECEARLPSGSECRVVFSFGVNDTVLLDGAPRVATPAATANLAALLAAARARGWPVLMVGPPPVDDVVHNRRIAELDSGFAGVCAEFGVPYAGSFGLLAEESVWADEVRAGDGAHPGAAGYAVFARQLLPAWRRWWGY